MACANLPEPIRNTAYGTDRIRSPDFAEQLTETREIIQACFKRTYEALQFRERNLLSHVEQIEIEYNNKMKEMQGLVASLEENKTFTTGSLSATKLDYIRQEIFATIDRAIAELTADTDSSIEFEWDSLFETDIEQLGSIKINGQTNISPTRTFSPQVKPVVPDYKAKQVPITYCCKKYSEQKAPGEMNGPRGIAVHYKTGNIYIADQEHNRVQVFLCNGEFLFMFNERMNKPLGISLSKERVFVTQFGGNSLNMYELGGKYIKSVGSKGSGEAQFESPYGLAVSDRTNNIYVCDYYNSRIKIFTEDLLYISMLGIGVFNRPRDIKVMRDRILVLDESDPCMFVLSLDHVLTNRLITRGDGKQTNNPICFDIDREYNIIMSDYSNHCVYVFNQEGELIHKFGKKGQDIGELNSPWGVALDNTGRIITICHKNTACLQFF